MLLDRKRINKWAKWVALGLALVFAVSFLLLGVGSGTGLNVLGGGKSGSAATVKTPEQRIADYNKILQTDSKNADALLGIATQYEILKDYSNAAAAFEQVIKVQPKKAANYLRLASDYLRLASPNYEAAARVLNLATSVDPTSAQAFLQLGVAQRGLGNTKAAILAWNRYLQLDPNGDAAKAVKAEVDKMTGAADTGTATTQGGTTTTAGQ